MKKYGNMIELEKADKDFYEYDFVLRAVCKDDSRGPIRNLLAKANQIICIDGYCLHISEVEEPLEDGLYYPIKIQSKKIIMATNPDGGEFPAYSEILPKNAALHEMSLSITNKSFSSSYTRIVRLIPKYLTINMDFFKRLQGFDWTVEIFGEEEKVISFRDRHRQAIIALMRT